MKGLFYYIYNLPNSTTGVDDLLVQEQAALSSFVPLFLLFIFFVVFLGGVARQKAKNGTADYPMWAFMGCISSFFMVLLMSVITGLVNTLWLAIVIVITLFAGAWLLIDRKAVEG